MMSDTASTSRPTVRPPIRADDDDAGGRWARWSFMTDPEAEVDDRQDRAAQVDDAASCRREPCGSGVAGVQPRISRTAMMSTQILLVADRGRRSVPARWRRSAWCGASVIGHSAAMSLRSEDARRPAATQVGHDGVHVEDEGDAAVAQDGRGGDALDLLVVGVRATFDDDLALAVDGVGQQGGARAPASVSTSSTRRRMMRSPTATGCGSSGRQADVDERHEAVRASGQHRAGAGRGSGCPRRLGRQAFDDGRPAAMTSVWPASGRPPCRPARPASAAG
jgi:hypothetical protein